MVLVLNCTHPGYSEAEGDKHSTAEVWPEIAFEHHLQEGKPLLQGEVKMPGLFVGWVF